MIKNILNLKGVTELTKNEKRSITGGLACVDGVCPKPGAYCCFAGSPEGICRLNGQGCF
ncbi:hypothetical protein [Flavobacterium sp. ov086]|uniref:hypothetical protein n=1 Tax=Flavobacterium sp. ov086 TaxID=1761785 RepID=UPI000B6B8E36|nr:hypothetical protein [Flavobacterium sp. ov086]SNR51225.1 hypothetical protein SAMN04487979_1095 [Flavobacterium sp. ov086]